MHRLDVFTKDQSKSIKGLFALVVLVHHVYQKALIGQDMAFVDYFFRSLGALAVGVFLFISGYGLYMSVTINKSSNCAIAGGGKILIYRVLPILSVNMILILAYSIVRFILLDEFNFMESLRSIAFGGETVSNGWYLQVIVWFYFGFIVTCLINSKHLVPILTIMTVAYMVVCFFKGVHSWWYVSSLAFPLGAGISKYSDKITMQLRNRGRLIAFSTLLLFACMYLVRFFVEPNGNFKLNFILFLCLPASVVLFAFLIYLSSATIPYKSRLLKLMGNYYLEIYVLQGLVFILLRNNYWTLANPWLFVLASVIGTLLMAYIAKPLFVFIQTKTRKLAYA